jgi:hypothetical protein
MRSYSRALSLTALAIAMAACDSPDATTGPDAALAAERNGGGGPTTRTVRLLDRCDPTSFNAVLGAGTCIGNGEVTFDKFIRQLEESGVAHAWRMIPPNLTMRVGQTLLARNIGGEAHTFTEVEEFGGGIVPMLNDLSGNPIPAPECLALAPSDFIPPGGTQEDEEDEAGTELYQCCLHPWMRTVVHIHDGDPR